MKAKGVYDGAVGAPILLKLRMTEEEASALSALVMNGVYWAGSGTVGQVAEQIYCALDKAGIHEFRDDHTWVQEKGSTTWREQ